MASQISGIHHINFLVRDLDEAEPRYRELLGLEPALRGELPGRGVITARFRLGESWLEIAINFVAESTNSRRQLTLAEIGSILLETSALHARITTTFRWTHRGATCSNVTSNFYS